MPVESPVLCITKEGYQAVIDMRQEVVQATIIDRSTPGYLQLTQVPVVFAVPYTIANIRRANRRWQQTHIQLERINNSKLLLVGKQGLRGGGFLSFFHICWLSSCQPYRCDKCNYACPNNSCFTRCSHRTDHQCASREATQRREQEERQEQIQRAQEEREHQERIKQEQAERVRLQHEREARQRERQTELRMQREREEFQRREHEKHEELMQQRERERRKKNQERVRHESEQHKRQEQLRELREREEKETINKKLYDAMLATSVIQDNEADYVSEDEEVVNRWKFNRTATYRMQQNGPIKQDEKYFEDLSQSLEVKPSSRLLFETPSTVKEVPADNIYESTLSHDQEVMEFWFKKVTVVNHNLPKLISCVLNRLEENMSAYLNRLADFKLNIKAERKLCRKQYHKDRELIVTENIWNQIWSEAEVELLRHMLKAKAFQQLSRAITRNLSNVSVNLVQNIVEYVYRGGKLQISVVKRFPVFRWIEQSFIVELVSFPNGNVDTVLLDLFRGHWLAIKGLFEWQQRRELLYSLRMKQLSHGLTLSHVNDILNMVCKLQNRGFEIVCSEDSFWYRKLKRCWLKTTLTQKDCDEETTDELLAKFMSLPWNCLMLEQFLIHIGNVDNQRVIIDMLNMIVNEGIAYPVVMNIVNTQCSAQNWVKELKYQLLILSIYKQSPLVARVVDEKLGRHLRVTNIGPSLKCFIEQNLSTVEHGLPYFSSVLEHAFNYQISMKEWDDVIKILKKEKNPLKWVEQIDKQIVSHIFGDSYEYSLEDLIDRINKDASDVVYVHKVNLLKVYNTVDRAYNSKAYSFMNHPLDFDHFINNSSFITVTDHSTLLKIIHKPISVWKETDVRIWAGFIKCCSNATTQQEMVAVIKRAIELCHKFSPRIVQLLSLLVLANPSEDHGRLAQINTGEGKSIIVAMLAALHAVKGDQVDVVTTSTELSIPEVKKQRPFFELLNLTVDENSPERDKKSVYDCNIVYGTASGFQSDILRAEFLGNDCRLSRKYQVIIVDEVDSMLFDARTHSVRLADECPGMNHLEVPLAVIWHHIHYLNKHMISLHGDVYFIAEDFEILPGQQIQLFSGGDWMEVATVVDDKRKFITKHTENHLRSLLRSPTDAEKNEYKEYQALDLKIMYKEEELSKLEEKDRQPIKDELELLHRDFKKLAWNQRNPILDIPEHLRSFALTQVPVWIKNAILAEWAYKKDAHYTVMDGRIVPVNFNDTGDLQTNMIWSDGLTQFLQIKEGLRMDPESISTNFISNISFFQRYGTKIYGLTGTLGEQSTREFLKEMYGTDMVVIPPYKHVKINNNFKSDYRCKELIPLVFSKQANWYQSVKENALYHAQNQRAVLVICKFISHAKFLTHMLQKVHDRSKIFTYTGAEVKFEKESIDSGEIVVATNIAGRGTDFKTSKNVEKHGGLCVLVTFLPESFRVEMQNVGRTAREGKRGMAQLIIFDQNGTSMESIRELRQVQENQATAKAISDAKKILIQDHLFQRFCRLENDILPSYEETRKAQDWNQLNANWMQCVYNKLNPQKVAEKTTAWTKTAADKSYSAALEKLSVYERSKLNKEDLQRLRVAASEQVGIETDDFKKRYEQNVMNSFVSKYSNGIDSDTITLFKNGQKPVVNCGELANRFKWNSHERKGVEESWGLWLKGNNLDNTDATIEQATALFQIGFEQPFQRRAESDELIQNPFYYVLKGNEMFNTRNIQKALHCYDRAIDLDPVFSVNARYNKAQALLSYPKNKGGRQEEALKELNKAKDLIKAVYRPNLITFDTLIALQSCKELTSQHVQHQLNVLSKQEDFIENACQIIETAQTNHNNVKITLITLTETLSDGHERAILEANENGLANLFIIEEKLLTLWKFILVVALLGVVQIAASHLLIAYAGLKGVSSLLLTEGVLDMITAARSAVTGEFNCAVWALKKTMILCSSLAFFVIDIIHDPTATLKMDSLKKFFYKFKGLPQGVTRKKKVLLAIKEAGVALGKGYVKECFDEASLYYSFELVMKKLKNEIFAILDDSLTKALISNPRVVKALEQDERMESSYWKRKFLEEGMDLLKDKENNKYIEMFKKLAQGVSKGTILYAKDVLDIPEARKCLYEFSRYTNSFIYCFNERVSFMDLNHHQTTVHHISQASELNCNDAQIDVQQVDADTSYSTQTSPETLLKLCAKFREPSTAKTLANEFKRTIVTKLFAAMQDSFITPSTISVSSNATTGLFKDMEDSVVSFREKIKIERDRPSVSNTMANLTPKSSEEPIESERYTRRIIEQISSDDYFHDTTSLSLSSSVVKVPIYVYDENSNLKYIAGSEQPGKPIYIKHYASSANHAMRHFSSLDPNIEISTTEKNSGVFDAIVRQLNAAERESLEVYDVADLRNKIVEQILANPRQAKELYEHQSQFERIAPNRTVLVFSSKLHSKHRK